MRATSRLRTFKFGMTLLLLLVNLLILDFGTASAATFTVTNTNNSGAGSLRQAILSANATAGADTISFGAGAVGTITLASPLPVIEETLTITGPGAATLAVSGNNTYRVFEIDSGVSVTISGLTIRNGYASYNEGTDGNGGGIRNAGSLTLTNVVVRHNRADYQGGGIYSEGSLTLTNAFVRNNQASSEGGGIYSYNASLTVQTSEIYDNHADYGGGGLYSYDSPSAVQFIGSSLYNNTAGGDGGGAYIYKQSLSGSGGAIRGNSAGGSGGGLYLGGSSSSNNLTLNNMPVYDNTAVGSGGGIAITSYGDASVSLTESNLYSNTAGDNSGWGSGGGLYVSTSMNGAVALSMTEVYSNVASYDGGGIYLQHYGTGQFAAGTGAIRHNRAENGAGGGLWVNGGYGEEGSTSVTLLSVPVHDNEAGGEGGGIYIRDYGSANFTTDRSIYNNTAAGSGGGLYLYGNQSDVQLSGVDLYNNTSGYDGGGAYIYGRSFSGSDGSVWGNSAGNSGGGLHFNGSGTSSVSLNNMPIHTNVAGYNGGGVAVNNNYGDSAVTLTGSDIYSNTAGTVDYYWGSGGGLYVSTNMSATVALSVTEVYSNLAYGSGGGIYVQHYGMGEFTAEEGVIRDNHAQNGAGGGLWVNGGYSEGASTSVTLLSAPVHYNAAKGDGGGIYVGNYYGDVNVDLTASHLYNNTAGTFEEEYWYWYGSGGGLYVSTGMSATVSLSATEIHSNVAYNSGGGLYLSASGAASFTSDRSIWNNTAVHSDGGGFYVRGQPSDVELAEIDLYHNTAGGRGGGGYVSGSTFTGTGLTIWGNNAAGSGGGLFVGNDYWWGSPHKVDVTLASSAIYSNTAGSTNAWGSGGGLYISSNMSATVSLNATDIYSNTAYNHGGGAYLQHSGEGIFAAEEGVVRHNRANHGSGGGLWITGGWGDTSTTNVTLVGMPVHDNYASESGGGVYLSAYGSADFSTEGSIFNNTAQGGNGGGLYVYGVPSNVQVNDADLYNNTAGGNGGGLYVHGVPSNVQVSDADLYNNSAGGGGGGGYVSGSTFTGTGITIWGNSAEGGRGGGLFIGNDYWYNADEVEVTLSSGAIYSNTASGGYYSGQGGGIYVGGNHTTTVTLDNIPVYANWASNDGGGLYVSSSMSATLSLSATDVYSNFAQNSGGGVYFNASGLATFSTAGSLWSNTASQGSGGGLYLTGNQSDVQLSGADLYNNTAGSNGGGAYLYGSSVTGTGANIWGNSAGNNGGGLIVGDNPGSDENATFTFTAGAIHGNNAGSHGGGLYIYNSGYWWGNENDVSVTLTEMDIYGNSAGSNGGGIGANQDYWYDGNVEVTLNASLLRGNSAHTGAGAYVSQRARLDVNGGEISSNAASNLGGGLYVAGSTWLTGTHVLSNTATANGDALYQNWEATIQAVDGCIVGNGDTAVINDSWTTLVATDNWWGVSNGPRGAGPGLGDSVGTAVDFSNFKTTAPAGCPDISPIITISKSADGMPAPGETVTYSIVVSNTGIATDPGVTVSDTLPAEVDFAQWLEQPAGATVTNDWLHWPGSLAGGETVTFTFAVTHVGGYSQQVTNTADVYASLENGSAQATYTTKHGLFVQKQGSGDGAITSSPDGIDCGSVCEAGFVPDTVVTLVAAPVGGAAFLGWSGACSGTGDCVVTMDESKSVTASFYQVHSLSVTKVGEGTVTSEPAGIDCGATCAATFESGTVVTLTAVAASGFVFTSWSGDCTGDGDCVLTVDDDKSVTANFLTTYALTVAKDGGGGGTVTSSIGGIDCGATCSAAISMGEVVTLTATADAISTFDGWSPNCTVVAADMCMVTMDEAKTVTATFNLKTYALNVSKVGDGQGIVTLQPPGVECDEECPSITEIYEHGTEVTLTATVVGDTIFGGWLGACAAAGENASCTLTMDGAKNVSANFTRFTFPLEVTKSGSGSGTVTSSDGGINCGGDCSEEYDPGTVITLTATANIDSTFTGWSGACTGTDPCVVTMSSARSLNANFVLKSFSLTLDKLGSGTGTVASTPAGINCAAGCNQASANYNYGTVVNLAASPSASSVFAGWSGACTGAGACQVTMTAGHQVTATFTIKSYALTVSKTGSGSGTVTSDPAGIDCGADCSESYNHGALVNLTAVAAANSTFTGWSGACTGAGSCQVTMDAAKAVTANFAIKSHALSVTKTGSGTVTSSPAGINCGADCNETYNHGVQVTLTATANAGSEFTGWGGACADAGTNSTCTLTMDGDKSVSATFVTPTFRLNTFKAGGGSGTITSNPAGINCGSDCQEDYTGGTTVILQALPNPNHVFVGWSGACNGAAPCVLFMNANQVVTGTFAIPGNITGSVTITGTQPAYVGITAYRQSAGEWWPERTTYVYVEGSATAGTPVSANYTLSALPPGTYRVYFQDQNNSYQSEFYNSVKTLEAGSNISVADNTTASGINATLDAPVEPEAEATTETGTVTSDPNTGEITIGQPWGAPSDITIVRSVTCANGSTPTSVTLFLGNLSFPMTETPPGSGKYQATIPAAQRTSGELEVRWQCGNLPEEDVIGRIVLYDPSGIISDAVTGQPVQGATVTLYRIPGWRPDTATETRECRTIDTRNGNTWNNEPAADPTLGAAMNTVVDAALMSPNINPQITNSIGYYGWDVAEGCFYVIVTAEGYQPKISPVVGVPPEVTDLDLKLTPNPLLTVIRAGDGGGTVTSTPAGINCGQDCSESYDVDTVVTLTATPDANSTFSGWSGACTGTTTCQVTMTGNKEVTATFGRKASDESIYLPFVNR
jgi:uncharacterized repeat protein (TIGR01451 family)